MNTDTVHIDTPEEILNLLSQGVTLGTFFDYTDEEYEAVYALGHSLYMQEHYNDACKCFAFLVMHHQAEKRFFSAFASSLQMLKRYEEALQYHCMASVLDIDDPLPTFHTAECMIGMGHKEDAIQALEQVLIHCENQAKWSELEQRSLALLTLMRRSEITASTSP